MTQGPSEAVYEMMWDCRYCGQKKLLGLTHRFCAGCGAPQDPAARYFPPDEEKVAVQDHPFVGADVACPACKQPMGRAAKCCTNCGSPIEGGVEVARRADVVVPPPGATPLGLAGAQAPAKKSSLGVVLAVAGVLGAVVLVAVLVAVLWKKDAAFEVTGREWQRDIVVEVFDVTRKSAWCDERPAGAREVSRRKEPRGTTKVKDGETCQTRKKDMGNGTYKEVRECTPKYKDVPATDDRCELEVTAWKPARTLTEKGTNDAPKWPAVAIARPGSCVGCEREGPRNETYTVNLRDTKSGATTSCTLPEAKWAAFAKGTRWKGQSRVLTGGVDCGALVRR
jgi:hypothetical protein